LASSLHWVHRDELPEYALSQLQQKLPCVAVDRGDQIEILISREALRACEGDYGLFEALLATGMRELLSEPSPALDGKRSG
jgi:hypothetical protein